MDNQLSFVPEVRSCEWCGEEIPRTARRDAETCSKSCRQARHRFRIDPGPELDPGEKPMQFGYADPPYPGKARYYKDQPTFGGEVDHGKLVADLVEMFPAGWALSTSADALRGLLPLCPDDIRVSAWVKGSRAGISYRARSAWEPVIFWRGRERRMDPGEVLDDVLLWGGRQPSHPGALVGMKSAAFSEWMFRQLGAARGDDLVDLFPGSGAVGRAWRHYAGAPVVVSRNDGWNGELSYRRRETGLPSRLEESRSRGAARRDGKDVP